jgi:hypothetical protein
VNPKNQPKQDRIANSQILQQAIAGGQKLRDRIATTLYLANQEIERLRTDYPDGRIVETIPYIDGSILLVVNGSQAEQAYNAVRPILINGPWEATND